MDPHTIEQWMTILGRLPAPTGRTVEEIMAERILGDILGYQHPSGGANTYRRRSLIKDRDVKELANALTAYAKMLAEYGVKP